MGPDEFPTREELGLMLKLVQARLDKSARAVADVIALLKSKNVLTDVEVDGLAARLNESPEALRLADRLDKFRQFAEVHKTARQCLDPPLE